MEKGKGKCIVCGNDEIALAPHVRLTLVSEKEEDRQDWEWFEDVTAHACTNCGFIQLTSKKA
jgi:predicted nucleic-acid-binding Zn-ribbon protein